MITQQIAHPVWVGFLVSNHNTTPATPQPAHSGLFYAITNDNATI